MTKLGFNFPAAPVPVLGRGGVPESCIPHAAESDRYMVFYRRRPEARPIFLMQSSAENKVQHYAARWRDWTSFDTFIVCRF